MAEPRQRRAATEEKVTRLLDAAEELILTQGYAAVTSRNVAARVGIQAPLVHYYFTTIDDLFVALLHRRADRNVERMVEALASPQPLRAWWDLASDPRGTALFVELVAAANHRPALKAEVGKIARALRRTQIKTLHALLPEYGLDVADFPPALVAAALQGLAFGLVTDEAAGYDTSTKQARDGARRLIASLEQRRRPRQAPVR
jgi:AcrR family transcriptional regulator